MRLSEKSNKKIEKKEKRGERNGGGKERRKKNHLHTRECPLSSQNVRQFSRW
jgi:hypothetical protein